jgi:hypothetical protein
MLLLTRAPHRTCEGSQQKKVLALLAVARDGVEERHVCGGQLKRWRFQVCSEVLPMGKAQGRRAAMLQHAREQHLRW